MGRLTTPRSIDPKDIRVGDRISMQGSDGNTEYAYTFTVADIRDGLLVDANGQRYSPANGYVQIVDRRPIRGTHAGLFAAEVRRG